MSSSNFYNPQNDGVGFSKRWDYLHKTTRIFFEGFHTPLFCSGFWVRSGFWILCSLWLRSGFWVGAFVRSESALLLEQGFNRLCSMDVQCLFNGCSMVVTMRRVLRFLLRAWMRTRLLFLFRLPWVFVFWWLRLEFIWVVVFPGRRGKKSGCLVRRCVREVWNAKRHPCESPQNGTGAGEDGGGNRLERKVFEQASNESDEKNKEDEMDEKKETDTNTVGILPN